MKSQEEAKVNRLKQLTKLDSKEKQFLTAFKSSCGFFFSILHNKFIFKRYIDNKQSKHTTRS